MVRNALPDRTTRLRMAEVAAHSLTLAALVVTFALQWWTRELNPVAAAMFDTLSYPGTAFVALLAVSLIFRLYRRVAESYPRPAEAGAWAVVAVGAVDVTVNTLALTGVGLRGTVPAATVGHIALAGLAGWALVPVLERRRAVVSVAGRLDGSARVPGLRTTALAVVLLTLVLTPVVATIALPGDESVSPVTEASAAGGTVLDDFESGSFDGSWTTTSGLSITSTSDEVIHGTYSAKSSSGSSGVLSFSSSTPQNLSFWYNADGSVDDVIQYQSGTTGGIDLRIGDSGQNIYFFNGASTVDTGITLPTSSDVLIKLSNIDFANNEYDIEAYDSSGSLIGSYTDAGFDESPSSFDEFNWNGGSSPSIVDDIEMDTKPVVELQSTPTPTPSQSTPTPTPAGTEMEYTMGVCYRGSAQFDPLGATASWAEVPAGGEWVGTAAGNSIGTTEFDQDKTTTQTVRDSNTTNYNVDIATDRAYFSIQGLDPRANNNRDLFGIVTPWSGDGIVTDPAAFSLDGEYRDDLCGEDGTPTGTPQDTPFPSPTPEPTPLPGTPGGDEGDISVLGVCTVPDGNSTKKGLLVEYWDPTYSTESLWYQLSYQGINGSEYIRFDSPKGYYYGCSAGGDGIDPGAGIQWPDNTTVEYPNGTSETFPNGTTGEFPDGSNVTTPNGTDPSEIAPPQLNGSANLTDGSQLPFNETGFEDRESGNQLAGFGGGGGPLIGDGAGAGAPLLLTAAPAALAVGYAYLRRRNRGGSGGSTGGAPPRGGAP